MEGCSRFNGGRGVVFQMGGSFLSGECSPWGASFLMRRFEKNRRMGAGGGLPPTMGKPGKGEGRGFPPLWENLETQMIITRNQVNLTRKFGEFL